MNYRCTIQLAEVHQIVTEQPNVQLASLPTRHRHSCATFYVNLFDLENNLHKDIGQQLIDEAMIRVDSTPLPQPLKNSKDHFHYAYFPPKGH